MKNSHIEYIELKERFKTATAPNDPLYPKQRYLDATAYDWDSDIACDDRFNKVFVVDNAFFDNEDIVYKQNYDVADNDNDTAGPVVNTLWMHGTNVAGVVGAQTNNDL